MKSLEELQGLNSGDGYRPEFKKSDYETYKRIAVKARPQKGKVKLGDLVKCVTSEGEPVSSYGRVTSLRPENGVIVCVKPMVPFLFESGKMDTSGGYFFSAKLDEFKLIGQREAFFKTWGHQGMCAGGAFYFPMKVNFWEVSNENIY